MFLTGLCGIADGVLQYVGKGNKILYSCVIQIYYYITDSLSIETESLKWVLNIIEFIKWAHW